MTVNTNTLILLYLRNYNAYKIFSGEHFGISYKEKSIVKGDIRLELERRSDIPIRQFIREINAKADN